MITCSHLHKLLIALPRETDDSVSYYSGKISSLHSQATTVIVMAIFMTLLGKYSTRSHQWERELWQGDKMEAVIYLGASGQQLRGQWLHRERITRAEPPLAELQPYTTGLHVLGLWRPVVNAGLCETFSDPHASWSTPACAASLALGTSAVAGWQASGKSKETSGLQGRKPESFSRCWGGRVAYASCPGQRSSKCREMGGGEKGVISPSENKLKRRSEEILLFTALPCTWQEHMCLVSTYMWQIKENQEDITHSNLAVLWSSPVLQGTIIKSLRLFTSTSALLNWSAQGQYALEPCTCGSTQQ